MILDFIIELLVVFLAVLFVSWFFKGIELKDPMSAVWAAVVLTLCNVFIKPVLVFISIPINFITLGLFSLVINGILLYFVAWLIKGFNIKSFGWAVLGALVISIAKAIFV